MKIIGNSINKIVNTYEIKKKQTRDIDKILKKDTLEISSVGKNLSSFAGDDISVDSTEKINRIKSEIENGTYKIDSKLIAEKILKNK